MIRGAVYTVDLGPGRGHEQRGKRPALVVSPSDFDWTVATVIPTSTTAGAAIYRPELVINGRVTRLLVDQIRTVDTSHMGEEPIDYLTRDDMVKVEHALASYLGLIPDRLNRWQALQAAADTRRPAAD